MCNIRGNFAIIIFSKLRDGTSGNLLYVSGYQSQFYGIGMKIRQCAQNVSARLSQWYLKLYMTRAMQNISPHYYFLYTIFFTYTVCMFGVVFCELRAKSKYAMGVIV